MSNPVNLIGDPISEEAINQIKIRASLRSQNTQDDKAINYKAKANNAFVKLTSFVKLTDDALAKAVGDGGTVLAEKWTLFNGATVGNGRDYNITIDDKKLPGYGQGGVNELGVRPMPGITSVQIDPAGMNGSVRIATIKLKCHNLNQLNIIDVLYFRFGFSMLLEWGNTMYATNDGNVTIARTPIDVFGRDWTKEEVLKELADRRKKSYGNYDGMLGLVTNYEWSLMPNGGYECTLKLTGIGAVMESLKVNGTEAMPANTYIKPLPQAGAITTGIDIANIIAPSQTTTNNYDSALSYAFTTLKNNILTQPSQAAFQETVKSVFAPGLNLAADPGKVDGYKKGFNAGYMSGQQKIDDVNFSTIYSYHFQSFKGADGKNVDMAYVPLGLVLAFLNNSCIAYDRANGKTTPLLYVDFNPDTNYCFRLPDQASMDPGVCLVDNVDVNNAGYKKWLETKGVDFTKLKPGIPTRWYTYVNTKILEKTENGFLSKYQDSVETRGKLMNILVNIDYVLGLVSSIATSDEKSSVYLSTFLDKLLGGISKVTGNINNFKTTYDDESNCIRIFDEQLTYNEQSSYPTFPVFGLSSVVRSMTLKTEANTKIGSMLAIEAMAGERNPSTDGRDGSAFTALNSRLVDRILLARKTPADDVATDGVTNRAGLFNSFRWEMYQNLQYKKSDVDNNVNFYSECMNSMKANVTKARYGTNAVVPDSTTAKGILPLSLNVTLDGISTFKLREGFTLPADRLPAQWKDGNSVNIGFVIAGMSHTIQGQSWITSVRGQMVNIPSQKTTASGKYVAGEGGSGRSAGVVDTATGCKTSYPDLPITDSTNANLLPFSTAISYLKSNHSDVAKAVFAIMFAEASKQGSSFRSAGGFNYAGVQTDAGKWGISGYFVNQFCRRDSERVRMFAGFESNEKFLDFMASRVKAKGFNSNHTADQWTSLYITKWWSPAAKDSYTKGTTTYNEKKEIYDSAMSRYA